MVRKKTVYGILKLAILIPLLVLAVLAGYSPLVGWTLPSALIFWFVLAPFLVFTFSQRLGVGLLWQSMVSMLAFYGWVVFMIYDHYTSNQFTVMLVSFAYNSFIMLLVMLHDRRKPSGSSFHSF